MFHVGLTALCFLAHYLTCAMLLQDIVNDKDAYELRYFVVRLGTSGIYIHIRMPHEKIVRTTFVHLL